MHTPANACTRVHTHTPGLAAQVCFHLCVVSCIKSSRLSWGLQEGSEGGGSGVPDAVELQTQHPNIWEYRDRSEGGDRYKTTTPEFSRTLTCPAAAAANTTHQAITQLGQDVDVAQLPVCVSGQWTRTGLQHHQIFQRDTPAQLRAHGSTFTTTPYNTVMLAG